jgi:hypothetical protein
MAKNQKTLIAICDLFMSLSNYVNKLPNIAIISLNEYTHVSEEHLSHTNLFDFY